MHCATHIVLLPVSFILAFNTLDLISDFNIFIACDKRKIGPNFDAQVDMQYAISELDLGTLFLLPEVTHSVTYK